MTTAPATALTISGSDPSGGAGLQADLKAFQAHGVYGMAAPTLLTVQNTRGVERVEFLAGELVAAQARAACADIPPDAWKTGSLGTAEVLAAVAEFARELRAPLVVDPVMVSKHGHRLVDETFERALAAELAPVAAWLTPNRFEAERLLGRELDSPSALERAALELLELGPERVLLKGGLLAGQREAIDVLAGPEGLERITHPALEPRAAHGAGCLLSACLTARLARGEQPLAAARSALEHVHRAMAHGARVGGGIQPPDPFLPPA